VVEVRVRHINIAVNCDVTTVQLEHMTEHEVTDGVSGPPFGRVQIHIMNLGEINERVIGELDVAVHRNREVVLVVSGNTERRRVCQLKIVDLEPARGLHVNPHVSAALHNNVFRDDSRVLLVVTCSRIDHSSLGRELVFVVNDESALILIEESASTSISTAIDVDGSVVGTTTGGSDLLSAEVEATIENYDAAGTAITTIGTVTALCLNSEFLADSVGVERVGSLKVDVATTATDELVSALSGLLAEWHRIGLNCGAPAVHISRVEQEHNATTASSLSITFAAN